MLDSVQFIASQYLLAAVFALAFYGYGNGVDRLLRMPVSPDALLRCTLRVAIGMGVFIVALQLAGMVGLLKKDVVRGLLLLGVLLVFWRRRNLPVLHGAMATGAQRLQWHAGWNVAALLVLAMALLVELDAPLYPPIHWDELMYHLPHAREWLQARRITVNEWLRYPYFPYNFNLLYVASMSVGGELYSHLLHAMAGWVAAVLVFRLTQNHYGPVAAALAVCIWVGVSAWFFQTAYIDLGAALFIFAAAFYYLLWLQEPQRPHLLLVMAAFFLGLAAGTKYQALSYLPLFVGAALLHERRLVVWAKVLLAFLVPCLFWYVRNLIVTGNPVTPLAGSIFGYWDWNAQDFAYQLVDLKNARNWPPVPLWLALLPLFFPQNWRDGVTRWLMLVSLYATLVWFITSRYDRYLVPQYPVISILAALGLVGVVGLLLQLFRQSAHLAQWRQSAYAGRLLLGFGAAVLLVAVLPHTAKDLRKVPVSEEQRHGFISWHAQNFEFMQALRAHFPGRRIYQLGLEGGLFYGPSPIYGDHFGPWRYRDFGSLAAPDLYDKLRQQGFDALAVHKRSVADMENKPDFARYFEQAVENDGHKAYRLRSAPEQP